MSELGSFAFKDEEVHEAGRIVLLLPRHVHFSARFVSLDILRELLSSIIAVAAGQMETTGGDPFDFVRTHAEWRARHHVPLTASLHAYRLAHKTYWEFTRESLLRHAAQDEALHSLTMLSDFWIEFFDQVGAVLAEAHAVEERLSAAQSTRAYVGWIDDRLGET